jgi:VanZ family protein
MKAWILRFGPLLAIMAIIFTASDTPGTELPSFGIWDMLAKKGGHMIGYALFAAACHHALANNKSSARIYYLIAFFLTVLYAATDEWHQSFTPERSPAIKDVCIDAAGGFIGLALLSLIRSRFSISGKSPKS